MTVFSTIILLFVLLTIIYVVSFVISLFKKKADTYYICEDGSFRQFGRVEYNAASDNYRLTDTTQPVANRFQGYSSVENSLAWIHLRDDPSYSSLSDQISRYGYVDLVGNIYDKNHNKLGYITDLEGKCSVNGTRRWYELWMKRHSLVYLSAGAATTVNANGGAPDPAAEDICIGKISESGRIGNAAPNVYTITARAGAFALLYRDRQPAPQDEGHMMPRTTWKDTALISSLIYAFVYAAFYITNTTPLSLPALGEQIGFVVAMLGIYFMIWALVRQFKIERSLDGNDIDDFLMMFNRNTGITGISNLIVFFAVSSLLVSVFLYGSDFIPLQLAVLIGILVNRKYITSAPWIVLTSEEQFCEEWDCEDDSDDSDSGNKPVITPTSIRTVQYVWQLDSVYHSLEGELSLDIDVDKISDLRAVNPFRTRPTAMHMSNIKELIHLYQNKELVHKIIRYINRTASAAGLTPLEKMQFILDFVQEPNIKYIADDKSDEIGNLLDYARFPDETLLDGRGDCDCKAVLAAVLFAEAGYKTAYIITMSHAAVAVALKNKYPDAFISMLGDEVITKDGYMYYFCETTSDNFKIGDLSISSKDQIQEILYIN